MRIWSSYMQVLINSQHYHDLKVSIKETEKGKGLIDWTQIISQIYFNVEKVH